MCLTFPFFHPFFDRWAEYEELSATIKKLTITEEREDIVVYDHDPSVIVGHAKHQTIPRCIGFCIFRL